MTSCGRYHATLRDVAPHRNSAMISSGPLPPDDRTTAVSKEVSDTGRTANLWTRLMADQAQITARRASAESAPNSDRTTSIW
ncbi:MAG TPA: hypothetical protein VIR16_04520, partial [Candidatus Limnocylindrales bacterium]